MCVLGAESILPQMLRKPTLRVARLQGVWYGDISGDTRLPDDICTSIAESRLRTLHLRYTTWAGRHLVLPQTLKEFVVESYPQDENFGCGRDDEEIPKLVVVGKAKLELLALSMSCSWGSETDRAESCIRVGCWNESLLRSFSTCGCLRRVILPQDAYCITSPAVESLERALRIASLLEHLASWSVLSLQCQRLNFRPCSNQAPSANTMALGFALLSNRLMKLVLGFAHEGPSVEKPWLWKPLRGKSKAFLINDSDGNAYVQTSSEWSHTGFPTLATYCSSASDLHMGNAFVVGQDDLLEDVKWHNKPCQRIDLSDAGLDQHNSQGLDIVNALSRRQRRRQKDKLRKLRRKDKLHKSNNFESNA